MRVFITIGFLSALYACSGSEESGSSTSSAKDFNNIQIFSIDGNINDIIERGNQQPRLERMLDEAVPMGEQMIHWEDLESSDVSLPSLPRTTLKYAAGSSQDIGLHMGFDGTIPNIASVAAVDTVTFSTLTERSIILIKNTPTQTEALIVQGEAPNEYHPYVEDGLDYVGMCTYRSRSSITNRFHGHLKINGTGISSDTDVQSATEVSKFSGYFRITAEDTIPSLINFCQDLYAQKVRSAIKRDLELALLASATFQTSNASWAAGINAALYGPKVTRLKLDGHHYNVRKASLEISDNQVIVRGTIDHNVHLQDDDVIKYWCTVRDGEIFSRKMEISRKSLSSQSAYEPAAKELQTKICIDAYMDFRPWPD